MTPVTRRHVAAVLTVSLAAGPAVLTAESAAAPSAPASTTQPRGLLDGLLNPLTTALAGLTGPLGTMAGQLGSGTPPSSTELAPLATLLTNLGTPEATQLAALLGGSGTAPVNAAFLAQVQSYLAQITATPGLNPANVATLATLATTLQSAIAASPLGALVAGLPLGSGTLDPAQLTGLTGQLTALLDQLQNGTGASGTAFDSIVALLRQVAAQSPAPIGTAISSIADQLDAVTGTLSTSLVTPLSGLLMSISATPGVSGTPLATLIASLAGTLDRTVGTGTQTTTDTTPGSTTPTQTSTTPGSGTTPATTNTAGTKNATGSKTSSSGAAAGAGSRVAPRIAKVTYSKTKRALSVRFTCPAGKVSCASIVVVARGSKLAATTAAVVLAPGTSVTKTMKLNAATRKALQKGKVKLSLASITSRTQITTKSVTAAKTKVAKKKRSVKAKS